MFKQLLSSSISVWIYTHVNTHAHAFAPRTHTHKHTLPPRLVHQTVFNTNHWPVDVSAPLWGISSVQTLSLNSLSLSLSLTHTHTHTHTLIHTNSKDKHNQLFKTLVLAHVCFFFLLFLFCCFYSILWQPNSQEGPMSEIWGLMTWGLCMSL